jgi:hypothetical protein
MFMEASMSGTNADARIRAEVESSYGTLKRIEIRQVVNNFLDGSVYYVEFELATATPQSDTFCYLFVPTKETDRPEISDDGVDLVKYLQNMMDRRRSIFTRIGDFSLNDMIGAIIALFVTGGFMWVLYNGTMDSNKELVAVFSLVLGYYFGKTLAK